MTNYERVKEFHEAFGLPVLEEYNANIGFDRMNLRVKLIEEEKHEFVLALEKGDIIEIADALADLAYVTYGAALEFGIDLDAVFAEVHRSNMTKLGEDGKPIYREDGKALKGPNFELPDIKGVLGIA